MSKDITNGQLFEFMTKMYSDLNGKIDNMNKELQEGFKEVKNEIKKTNTKIDHEVMPKIDFLHSLFFIFLVPSPLSSSLAPFFKSLIMLNRSICE